MSSKFSYTFFTVLIENVVLNKLQSHVESQLNYFILEKTNLTENFSILKQWSLMGIEVE